MVEREAEAKNERRGCLRCGRCCTIFYRMGPQVAGSEKRIVADALKIAAGKLDESNGKALADAEKSKILRQAAENVGRGGDVPLSKEACAAFDKAVKGCLIHAQKPQVCRAAPWMFSPGHGLVLDVNCGIVEKMLGEKHPGKIDTATKEVFLTHEEVMKSKLLHDSLKEAIKLHKTGEQKRYRIVNQYDFGKWQEED